MGGLHFPWPLETAGCLTCFFQWNMSRSICFVTLGVSVVPAQYSLHVSPSATALASGPGELGPRYAPAIHVSCEQGRPLFWFKLLVEIWVVCCCFLTCHILTDRVPCFNFGFALCYIWVTGVVVVVVIEICGFLLIAGVIIVRRIVIKVVQSSTSKGDSLRGSSLFASSIWTILRAGLSRLIVLQCPEES